MCVFYGAFMCELWENKQNYRSGKNTQRKSFSRKEKLIIFLLLWDDFLSDEVKSWKSWKFFTRKNVSQPEISTTRDLICSLFYTLFFAFIFVRIYKRKFLQKKENRVFPRSASWISFSISALFIFTETMTKTSSEVQQQGDKIIKTTTTEGKT